MKMFKMIGKCINSLKIFFLPILFCLITTKILAQDSLKPPTMMIEFDNWKLYYEVKGNGEPILFIHGTPTSAFLWRNQIEALSKHYRVYAIDLPGWARSGKPDDFDYKLESYARILKQFLEKVGEKKITLGIHDLGASIGMTFYELYPEMVSKLIIFDTFAYMPGGKKLQWKLLYGFFLRIPLAGTSLHRFGWNIGVKRTDFFATLAFYNKKLATKQLVQQYRELALSSRKADYKTIVGNRVKGITGAVERNSVKVNVPTLIIWAGNDFLFPASAAWKLHENINGSVLKIIPECGHWLQEEKPVEVNGYILDFLKTN